MNYVCKREMQLHSFCSLYCKSFVASSRTSSNNNLIYNEIKGTVNLGTACINQFKVLQVWHIFIYKDIK